MRVNHYVIYDPLRQVLPDVLTVYRLNDAFYERQEDAWFGSLKLGLALWEGTFEGVQSTWLRWTDEQAVLIPTGKERAEQAEHLLAEERQRAERLEALLRQSGIDPEQGG